VSDHKNSFRSQEAITSVPATVRNSWIIECLCCLGQLAKDNRLKFHVKTIVAMKRLEKISQRLGQYLSVRLDALRSRDVKFKYFAYVTYV